MGGIKPIKSLRGRRQASQLPKMPRTYIRTTTDKVVRDRRRPTIQFGVDELEQRAVPKEGALGTATLPERILYKKLSELYRGCLLYTSPSPRDLSTSRMPSSA